MLEQQFLIDVIVVKVLESNSIYIVVIDLQGKYIYFNNWFCKKFNVDLVKVIGQDFMFLIVREDWVVCLAMVQECLFELGKSVIGKLCKLLDVGMDILVFFWEFKVVVDEIGMFV